MTQSTIINIVIIAAAIIYICYKQCVQQLVSNRDFLLPIVGAAYFVIIVINGQVGMDSVLFVVVGGAVGILTGLMSGQVVRVWRDHNTGAVYQRGGWSYVMVLVGLMVARVIIYIVLRYSGVVTGFGPINFAFIALALGNYLGRSINVHRCCAQEKIFIRQPSGYRRWEDEMPNWMWLARCHHTDLHRYTESRH